MTYEPSNFPELVLESVDGGREVYTKDSVDAWHRTQFDTMNRYFAFTCGRYPSGVGILSGAGLIAVAT